MNLKTKILSPLYLVALCFALPLFWVVSPSFRTSDSRIASSSAKRKMLLVRLLATRMAQHLGFIIVVVLLVPAVIAAGLVGTWPAFVTGLLFGFILMAVLPLLFPVPSGI